MTAEIICVGTELLLGETINTDAAFLGAELSKIGINVYHSSVVGDNKIRLTESINTALGRSDIVILSGGLGPTPDDLTKETAVECMGFDLTLHEESLERIKEFFKKINREMTDNNVKQAMLPENCTVLTNNCGTAPGCIMEKDGKAVILLPGPPNGLKRMYNEGVLPYLTEKTDNRLFTKTYHIFGIGESQVANELCGMMEKGTNPSVAPYAKTGEVHLRIAVLAKNETEAEKIMKPAEDEIYEKIGEYIYSTDGKSLPETVVTELIKRNITVSSAESCTGGMFAKMITDFSGVSEIFNESHVTYSNEAKHRILGVSNDTLAKYGAVSEQTAREMAEGVRRISGADIGISFTGIAGPGGGTPEKPVGLVYMAVACENETIVKKLTLTGERGRVRYISCLNGFSEIRKILKKI